MYISLRQVYVHVQCIVDWIVRFRAISDLFYGHYKYLMVHSLLLLKGKAFFYIHSQSAVNISKMTVTIGDRNQMPQHRFKRRKLNGEQRIITPIDRSRLQRFWFLFFFFRTRQIWYTNFNHFFFVLHISNFGNGMLKLDTTYRWHQQTRGPPIVTVWHRGTTGTLSVRADL